MNKNISYNDALGAVDESVLSFDTSKLCPTLQRLPVLQVFAAQRLIRRLAELKKSEALRSVIPITEAIGCIATPRDSITAECRMCAIYLFCSIRDQDESILRAILKRMISAKRSCEGCGLFVHTVLTESLNQCNALANFIADHLSKDEARRDDTDTHYWTDVLGLLEKEGFLKAGEQGPVPNLRNSSLRNNGTFQLRRLRLRTEVGKKRRKRKTRIVRTSSDITKCFDSSYNERIALLKLATMYTVCPDFVAEKIDARGLNSFCASRVRALCDYISSSQRQALTFEDALGLKSVASMMSNLPQVWTHSICRNGLTNEVVRSPGEGTDLFAVYRLWMPLEVRTQSAIKGVLCGEILMDTVLDTWMGAKGNMCSSVDQIVVAVLSHNETFQKLATNHFCTQRTATSSEDPESTVDTKIASQLRQVNKCLRCLEQSMIRGIRYPPAFWDQTVQVFHGLTDVLVLAVLHEVQGACNQHVKEAITRSRSVENQLQDHIDHQRIQSRKDCAILKVCDCSSVEMTWKHLRRSHFNAWRKCRCMNPNTMLVRVPNPSLCFSWACRMIGGNNKTRSIVEDSDSSVSIFLWLYGNPGWGGVQYNHSEREILRCVIDIALQDETGAVVRGTGEILAYALRSTEARENMLSDIAVSARRLMCDSKHESERRTLDDKLCLFRTSIEELWASAYQQFKFFKLRHESAKLVRTSLAETRGIESLLAMVAPCSGAIHDCIRDMPKLCEYIALTHTHLLANEGTSDEPSMQIRLIVGLLSQSTERQPSSKIDRFPQREPFSASVMCCFE